MTGLVVFSVYSIVLSFVFYYFNQPYDRNWWLKITTSQPQCVYYFEPFQSQQEASNNLSGYQADLEEEQANVVEIKLNQCFPPAQLTFCPEEASA